MADTNCSSAHRYFCADTAVNEAAGTVTVICVCTACGDFISKTFEIAPKK